mgnify:CR=1 FL=1
MNKDTQIFDLIAEERSRQTKGIELIASENFVSDQVMAAMGSVCTNKYAEGYPAARYYGGCEVVDKIENLAIERICKLYGAEYANVQPRQTWRYSSLVSSLAIHSWASTSRTVVTSHTVRQ